VDEEIREEGYDYYLDSPKFSPDGNAIAVCGRRNKGNVEENYGIYLYDLQAKDGFKVIYTGYVGYLDWTPDSEWIVFPENETYYKTDIYKIRKDGSEKTLLWDGSKFGYNCWMNSLNLSYDGKYIVVGLDSDENGYSILLLNSDGTGEPKALVSSSRGGMYPHFDAMPSKVLYYTYTGGESHYIEHINIDDCDYERIVEGYGPTTTLGCKYIYFERNGDIWEMRIY